MISASHNTKYYGYKLRAVCSVRGIIQSMNISPTSVHDIHYLKDIKQCALLADKGNLSSKWQLNLFDEFHIKLEYYLKLPY
ncbi:transposase [Formosa sp. PL04]|uniref:transposase n=1 Tax=Formosa sp. PL04 TaxID=3081755 RepID=UPI003994DC18